MKSTGIHFQDISAKPEKVYSSAVGERVKSGWNSVIWTIIGTGILLRFFHFLDNRSLWIDEIFLAANLVKMNFLELTAPYLDYEQKAPIGFLWLVRLCVLLFGQNEMALRLIPLLSGIASLFIFLPVARYFLKPLGVVVALGILAMAPPLVYHAVEIKQYGTELLATIITIYLYTRYHQNMNWRSLVMWGIWGAIIIWFSYTSIFILAGVAIGCSLYYLIKKDWVAFFRSILPFSMWLISFAINYFQFTYGHAGSEWLLIWFRTYGGFMPFPPTSAADLGWFVQKLFAALHYPLGLSWITLNFQYNALLRILFRMAFLPLLFLAVGMFMVYRQDKKLFLVMVFPFLLHLLASGLEIYPFFDRLTVYLAPWLILFIARGGEYATNLFPARAKWRYILPILLLAGPLANSAQQVANPALFGDYKKSYQRDALLYINDRIKPGDVVYLYWNIETAYRFYKDTYNLKFEPIVASDKRSVSNSLAEYFQNLSPELEALDGKKRVWLIYNTFALNKIGDIEGEPTWYYDDRLKPVKTLHQRFSLMGKELESYKTPDVTVSLFDMSAR